MRRFGLQIFLAVLLAAFGGAAHGRAAATNPAPDFKEVYELLQSHLTGVSDADLNRVAVEGMLTNLRGKVSLVPADGTSGEKSATPRVTRSMVLEDELAYVRVGRVADGLAGEISEACRQLSATN